jgi:quercetin dioxygenase-like cupin family protein
LVKTRKGRNGWHALTAKMGSAADTDVHAFARNQHRRPTKTVVYCPRLRSNVDRTDAFLTTALSVCGAISRLGSLRNKPFKTPRSVAVNSQPAVRTPGAKRAAPGEYLFDFGSVQKILGGPDHSTARRPSVEGDRIIIGLTPMAAGTGAEPHSNPNEQWIYMLEGLFRTTIDGKQIDAKPGSGAYIPAKTVHVGKAAAGADVVFFTVKDASHSLHGTKAT